MYKKIYQCRLCNEIIEKDYVNDIEANVQFSDDKENEINLRHFCENGDMGIAEFRGYQKIKEDNENKHLK